MPVPKRTSTSYIIENIQDLINKYNQLYRSSYVRDYRCFIRERNRLLAANNGDLAKLLNDPRFTDQLRDILTKFGMDTRASQLSPRQRFSDTISQVCSEFDLLNAAQMRIYTLNLHQMVGSQIADSVVRNIFNLFETPRRLSISGGFVVASKTMHFIMPELFIMLDGKHVGISLYKISDYYPHPDDGRDWFDVIPNYSGRKPNPSPRGEGRKLWDDERYCIALMYYKRIIQEWGQQNNATIEEFLSLDAGSPGTAARIIDKALW